jgi:ribA/ribD-fused uncharacterized protein
LKYSQNPDLLKILLETKETTLVEVSPFDKIWGIGLCAEDPRTQDETQWQGQNLLGKVLTELRENFFKNGYE